MMRTLFVALCAALCAMLIVGCAAGRAVGGPPPNVPQAGAEWKHQAVLVSAGPGAGDAARGDQWWCDFGDEELTQLISAGVSDNLDVRVALARRDAARATVTVARADLWPHLRGVVETRRAKIPERDLVRGSTVDPGMGLLAQHNPATRHSVELEASYEVDLWGRVRAGAASHAAELRATSHDVRTARTALAAEVATEYFAVRTADALLTSRRDREALLRDITRREGERLRAGVSEADALLRAQRDLLQLQQDTAMLTRERASAENRLAILLGRAPTQFTLAPREHWSAPRVAPPALLPTAVLETRPDIAAAGERVRVATARAGEARAARLPQLTLTSAAGYASESLRHFLRMDTLKWWVSPVLQLPLFDAHKLRAQARSAAAEAARAQLEYQHAALRALEEVENALAALAAAREREQAALETSQSLAKSAGLIQQQLVVGRVSRLPLLSIQAEESLAREVGLRAQLDMLAATVALMRALGCGWGERELPSRP